MPVLSATVYGILQAASLENNLKIIMKIRSALAKIFTRENAEKATKTAQQAEKVIRTAVRSVVPLKQDKPEQWYFKVLILSLFGVIILIGIAGLAGFLLTLKEPEDVVIPSLIGKELPEAIEIVQQYGLVPVVDQRFFNDPTTRGRIMEQEPREGAGVKAGRKVTMVLSKGAVLDKVGDYVTRNFEQVKEEIRTVFGSENPRVMIGSVTYTFDDSETGTILSQEPSPGTQLSRPVSLKLLVSKGKDGNLKAVPNFVGMAYIRAMEQLAASELPFVWTLLEANQDNSSGAVVVQDPAADASLAADARVSLAMSPPARVPAGNIFGIYQKTFPLYAVPVDVSILILDPSGTQQTLYTFKYLGGDMSFPYMAPAGSELIVIAFGKELDRQTLRKL